MTGAPGVERRGAGLSPLVPFLAHLPLVLWLFASVLFQGRVFFFRDIYCYYYPNYVFLERSLRQGVWPLWNPTTDAGGPFLMSDPMDLLLVGTTGAETALRLAPPLHVLLAMCGATALARRMGNGPWGSWAAGAFLGLSGFLLSSLNLFELSHGAAWAPWVLWAYLGLFSRASLRRAAVLGALGAIQLSTLAAETVLGTALFALVLTPRRPDRRTLARLLLAAGVGALLAAPTLLGARALLAGTERLAGFDTHQVLAFSLHPLALLEGLLPRFLGSPHTFSDAGFWGQQLFPAGFPYMIGIYLGPIVLMLAAGGRSPRLWALAAIGTVLALGAHGPAGPSLALAMRSFRSPVKFLFLADLALCLLAATGLEAAARRRGSLAWLLPGAALLLAGSLAGRALGLDWLGRALPETRDPRAQLVVRTVWPDAFACTGAICLGAGLALWRGGRLSRAAALLGALDLLIVNGSLNTAASPSFYELRPEVRSLLKAAAGSNERWFSFGVDGSRARWSKWVARLNSDVWLYYMDRQSLLPRATVFDGLDAAFDEDRTGWAPPLSTFRPELRRPETFPIIAETLRRGSVRWVVSWKPLPPDLVTLRGEVQMPEMVDSLRLYELNGALPRAYWSPDGLAPDPRGTVAYERHGPHEIRLRISAPPGVVVVTEGYHRDWHAVGPRGAVALSRIGDRYMSVATPGGDFACTLRFEPAWRGAALALLAAGCVLVAVLGTGRFEGEVPRS
jgi:hypothetical protein